MEPVSHRPAVITIIIAVWLDIIGGFLFAAVEHIHLMLGLYWAVTTATTVGYGDITPKTGTGHVIAAIVMISVIPLVSATFSLFTSAITTRRAHRHAMEIHKVLHHMREHMGIPHPDHSVNERS